MVDPLRVLPLDIVNLILQYFDFKQTVAILRVSKKWERFLSSIPRLWTHLDLSTGHVPVSLLAIETYVDSQGRLTHATVNKISQSALDPALGLLSRCPHLTYLEVGASFDGRRLYELFKTCTSLTTLVISASVPLTQTYLSRFLTSIPNIERLECHRAIRSLLTEVQWPAKLPRLKVLALSWQGADSISGFRTIPIPYHEIPDMDLTTEFWRTREQKIFDLIPNLQKLSLRYQSQLPSGHTDCNIYLDDICYPRLQKLEISGLQLQLEHQFSARLEHLCLYRFRTNILAELHSSIQLPNLKVFVLDDVFFTDPSLLDALLQTVDSTLKVLQVSHCQLISGHDIARIASTTRAFRGLTSLMLGGEAVGMRDLDNMVVSGLLNGMPELKVLRIPHSDVTGSIVRKIADLRVASNDHGSAEEGMMPQIEQLDIRGCEKVSSRMVKYGRRRGIQIIEDCLI
ncbi:hypothetical protein VTN77DRAFT_5155 [Rasamsonia byssochlamydoides]|uniref:uncharacterized protein n=1 Tax=Rasamsonia byssochlamydoides TaxID=89139 RepID=UPI0037438043